MINTANIREYMEVVGSDGKHVGSVDRIEGDRIKLTKSDAFANGQHHYVPFEAVDRVETKRVRLKETAQETMQRW